MESLELLEFYYSMNNISIPAYREIKKDLEKLKKLEEQVRVLNKRYKNKNIKYNKLYKQALQYDLALDKACEKLQFTCPIQEELVKDINCNDCHHNCQECWRRYFMKEVLDNE